MTYSIDDVVEIAVTRFKLNAVHKPAYHNFVRRQLNVCKDFDLNYQSPGTKRAGYPYFAEMLDHVLLFSYLTGRTPIIAGYDGHTKEKVIRTPQTLYLLRPTEIGFGGNAYGTNGIRKQTDKQLFRLIGRMQWRSHHYKALKLGGWRGAINIIGRDAAVARHLKRPIKYRDVLDCMSPNPLTFDHGGYRNGQARVRKR